MQTISEWWMWLGFFIFIAIMLFVDMFLLGGKRAHRISIRESLSWFIVWFTLALFFNVLLWWYLAHTETQAIANQKALEFFTSYLLEKSLSVDNMFVFIMIFNYFAVPAEYQRRVLLLGVFGAIVMRLVLILFGIWLVARFHWILLVFGAFLVFTGIKMWAAGEEKPDFNKNVLVVKLRQYFHIGSKLENEKFFVLEAGHWHATPLFLVLLLIEFSDLIFALDSIPAVFAITNDPFIVVTSNIFAILGLRSLYFLLLNLSDRFRFLKYGIALILVLVGLKMLISHFVAIPIWLTLGMILGILFICILLSQLVPRDLSKR